MKKLFLSIWILILYTNTVNAYDFGDWANSEIWEDEEAEVNMGSAYMEGEFLDGDILLLHISVQDMMTPVLGLAFHLDYEDNLAFLRYDPGEFLERGGDPFYLVTDVDGKIIFGETLRRDDSFPVGGGKILDFYFQILEGEEFSFKFDRGVVSTLDIVRQDIDEIEWIDSTLKKDIGNKLIDYTKMAASLGGQTKFNWIFVPVLVFVIGITGFTWFKKWRKNKK